MWACSLNYAHGIFKPADSQEAEAEVEVETLEDVEAVQHTERPLLSRGPLVDVSGKSTSSIDAIGAAQTPERHSWLSAAAGLLPGPSHLLRHTGFVQDATHHPQEGSPPLLLQEENIKKSSIVSAPDLKIRRFGRKCDEEEEEAVTVNDHPSLEAGQQMGMEPSFFQMAASSETLAKINHTEAHKLDDNATISDVLSENSSAGTAEVNTENEPNVAITDTNMQEMESVSAAVSALAHEVEEEIQQIRNERESLPVRISNVMAFPEVAPAAETDEEDAKLSVAASQEQDETIDANVSDDAGATLPNEDPVSLVRETEAAWENGSYNNSGSWLLAAGILDNLTDNASEAMQEAEEDLPQDPTANLLEKGSHDRRPMDNIPAEEAAEESLEGIDYIPHMVDKHVTVHHRNANDDKGIMSASFKVMMGVAFVGIILWACCLWLWYSHSALRVHVEALPVCRPADIGRKLPLAGGYDCAISKPVSSGHPVRIEGRVQLAPGARTLFAPLSHKESVLYSVIVTKQLHDGMHPVPVAFASTQVDFIVTPIGSPELTVHVRGEDVSLFDMDAGRSLEQRTFASAPEEWQDFVLTHRASAPSGEWQTSSTLRAESRPLEFQELALHVGVIITVVGELHRAADGTLSLQPWQVMDRSMDSHAGANSMKASWATSWERGGGGGGEGGGRSRSPSHHPPEASRKVLASDDPQLLCSKATAASIRQRCFSCCVPWDVQQNGF